MRKEVEEVLTHSLKCDKWWANEESAIRYIQHETKGWRFYVDYVREGWFRDVYVGRNFYASEQKTWYSEDSYRENLSKELSKLAGEVYKNLKEKRRYEKNRKREGKIQELVLESCKNP